MMLAATLHPTSTTVFCGLGQWRARPKGPAPLPQSGALGAAPNPISRGRCSRRHRCCSRGRGACASKRCEGEVGVRAGQ